LLSLGFGFPFGRIPFEGLTGNMGKQTATLAAFVDSLAFFTVAKCLYVKACLLGGDHDSSPVMRWWSLICAFFVIS